MSSIKVSLNQQAGKDAYLNFHNQDTNYGTSNWSLGYDWKANGAGSYWPMRPILEIDLSYLGAITVTGVTLTARVNGGGGTLTAVNCTMYRVRRSTWGETTATWNKYDGTNAWSTAGATNTTNDIDTANAVAFTSPTAIGSWTIADSANFRALVQDAVTNQSGILRVLLKFDNESASTSGNRTDNTSRASQSYGIWPAYLTITYTGGNTVSCAIGGTVTTATEADIVAGGKTITLTLTNDTWMTAGATFDSIRQEIIYAIGAFVNEAGGWAGTVRNAIPVANVVRTSNTVVTITLPAVSTYDITADEVVTVDLLGTTTAKGSGIDAAGTFTVTTTGTVALTGTATASITETDIVTGGKTIIFTLTGDTWVAAGATFDAQRQNIINGIDSAQAEGTGWDAVVKAGLAVTAVVRTSSTVVTVTLSAFASYNITAQETITATIPPTARTLGGNLVASPTFTVATAGGGGATSPIITPQRMKMGYGR